MRLDLARETPLPHQRSACPCCQTELIAKCGRINIHHWAHVSGFDCDHWFEPISPWHLQWQDRVKPECREIVIGEHRADIQLRTKHVIEIQHSPIPIDEVLEREVFYHQATGYPLTWIIDASAFVDNLICKERVSKVGNAYVTFHWKRPRKSLVAITTFLYFDLGTEEVLEVKKLTSYENDGDWGTYTSWGGWGYRWKKTPYLYSHLFGLDACVS